MADYTLSAKITGDSRGFEKAFSTAQEAADSFAKKFDSVGKKISSVGNSLTSKITKPALAAGTALAGITLAKGWNRLTGIDDARAKLQGLGHDAETIEAIMDSALSSVQGTAFGLDEAATTAANAVAAGIEPGKELNKYLSMIADTAAIAGTSMSEMGSIINKVQTGQTVYTEDLEQLADRGLPVYQWLAEEAGVAASEVKQLASDGQISSQMLYDAIDKNIGGAAQIMGETSFSAALDNIGASISRIGANFLDAGGGGGGFFTQLKPLMADFSESLSGLETKASELGSKFGQAFADVVQKIKDIKAQFDSLPEPMQNTILKASGIGAAFAVGIGPALKVIGPLVSGIGSITGALGMLATSFSTVGGASTAVSGVGTAIGGIAAPIGIAIAAVTALASAFTYLMTTNDGFRSSIVNTATSVGGTFQSAIDTVLPALQQLASVIGTTITTALNAIAPIISQIVALIGQVMAQIAPLMAQIISQLVPIISQIVQFIGQIIAQVAPLISQLVGQLAPVLQSIMGTISQLVSSLLPPITSILQAIMGAVEAIMPPVMSVLSTVIDVVSGIISAISPIVSTVGDIISGVMSVISPIISFVADIISGIVDVISPIISFIGNIVSKIISAISPIASTVSSVFQKIFSVISSIMNKVGSVMTKVFGAIKSAWNGLTGFVSGVFDGIASAFDSLVSGVKSVINGVIGGINSAIGIINKIPGVEIGKIPKLAHGTDNWAGGFAVMNEGGRGELTYLPNGAQVIPHDLSVKYAKEAARTNQTAESIDMEALGGYIISAMIEYGNRQGQAIEKGISNMGIYFERRPFGRVIADMGFQKG